MDVLHLLVSKCIVGKSTLLSTLTGTQFVAAAYEFTTFACIPGIIHYNDTKIQLLDLPGIIEGASEGKGRGRQVIAVAKSADIVLMDLVPQKVRDIDKYWQRNWKLWDCVSTRAPLRNLWYRLIFRNNGDRRTDHGN